MMLVALSIGVLLCAPLAAFVLSRSGALASALDSFVLVAVGGVVALHVVPQSAEIAGPAALVAVVIGLFLPIALHRVDAALMQTRADTAVQRRARDAVLLVVFAAGIFAHGMFDGTALAGAVATRALAMAVLLHRLPVGIALWTVVRPKLGLARLGVIVVAYAGGTLAGGALGASVLSGASAPLLAVVQAFVAGSILHIVAESAPFVPDAAATTLLHRVAGLVGAGVAALTLFVVESLEGAAHGAEAAVELSASSTFLALAFQCAPALALSFVLVGVLTALYPDGAPVLPGRGGRVADSAAGVVVGLSHPLCSCTVVPMYTSLMDRGTSPAAARAFLVAAPELGVPAVLLSARLLGLPFTLARVAGAAVLALLVGASAAGKETGEVASSSAPWRRRILPGLRHGVVDAVDHVGPWVALGLGVAALLEPALSEQALGSIPAPLQTLLLALLALPLYLCAGGATPLAALLVHKGVSAGAALAFLLVGPATSFPTLGLVRRLHGVRASVTFAGLICGGAVLVGIAGDLTLTAVGEHVSLALHERAESGPSAVEVISLALVTALLVASLLRQGVRGFLVQIMSPQHTHAGDHAHGPGCAHDHGPPLLSALAPFGAAARPSSTIRMGGPPRPPKARIALGFDPRGGPP